MDQIPKRCRPDVPTVSQLPPKKRATLKARDNEIDLNLRSPQPPPPVANPLLEALELIKTDPDKEHEQLEKGRKGGSYQCHQCDDEFQTNKKLLIHKATQHDNTNQKLPDMPVELSFIAKVEKSTKKSSCGTVAMNKPCTTTPGGKGTFECEICKVKFMKRGMLLCHITKTHPHSSKMDFSSLSSGTVKYEDKRWMCPYCDRRYLSSGKRREHIKKAHPDQEIPPPIKKAGREKAYVTFLETAQRKPHECPYCPMEYAHRTKLLKHCKEKHKDHPVPYKYKKWKKRDSDAREERGKRRDIEILLSKTNHDKQLAQQLEQQQQQQQQDQSSNAMKGLIENPVRNDNSIGTLDLWCDSNATGDSTSVNDSASLLNNNDQHQVSNPFNFSEDALDGLIDEDTQHSASSASFCHQPSSQFRSPTPNSDTVGATNQSSQSLPAQSGGILDAFFPTTHSVNHIVFNHGETRSISSKMDEIETSHILSDMTRAESNSTSSMLTFDPASFQSQPTPCRVRNATFSGMPSSATNQTSTTDLSMMDVCDDSAQSAPAGFTFDATHMIGDEQQLGQEDLLQQAIHQSGFGRLRPETSVIDETPTNQPLLQISELNNNKNNQLGSNSNSSSGDTNIITSSLLKTPPGVALVLDNNLVQSGQSGGLVDHTQQIVYVLADGVANGGVGDGHSFAQFEQQPYQTVHQQGTPLYLSQNQQNVIHLLHHNQPVLKQPLPKVISPPKRRQTPKGYATTSGGSGGGRRRRLLSPRKLAPKIQPLAPQQFIALTNFDSNTFVVNNSQLIFSPDLPK